MSKHEEKKEHMGGKHHAGRHHGMGKKEHGFGSKLGRHMGKKEHGLEGPHSEGLHHK